MKKWLALLAVIALVVLGWYFVRQWEFRPAWTQPKFGTVARGDVTVPITAAGLIHANQVFEIKPEASGEIIRVNVVEGTFVHAGDTLVVLDPSDEERLRDRAQANLDRAEALLKQAEVAVERAQVSIESAAARHEEIMAQAQITAFEWAKTKETLDENGKSEFYNPQQINDARARDRMTQAQLQSARIAIRGAELAKEDAKAAVRSQQASVDSARKELEDAQERLSETIVKATQDAIVTNVYAKPGMLVQSGTQSLTGGTPLMRLADVSKMKVIARVDEADYGRVSNIAPVEALPDMPGLRAAAQADAEMLAQRTGVVRLTVDAFPDDVFEGRIDRVEPQGSQSAAIIQFAVHVEITDPKRNKLPLGAQAQVEFTVESAVDALLVPAEAVKSFEEQRGVWVKTAPEPGSGSPFGKRFVPCRFGISDGEHTQVVAVLGDGELRVGSEVYTKLPQDNEFH